MKKFKDLSPMEMKILDKLCELEEADISTVQQCFAAEKGWKYTTVLTIFQRLYEKRYLKRKKEGRKYIYRPVVSRTKLFKMFLQKFFGKAFEKDPTPLVDYLFEVKKLNKREQKVLEDIFDIDKAPPKTQTKTKTKAKSRTKSKSRS